MSASRGEAGVDVGSSTSEFDPEQHREHLAWRHNLSLKVRRAHADHVIAAPMALHSDCRKETRRIECRFECGNAGMVRAIGFEHAPLAFFLRVLESIHIDRFP